MFFGEVTNPFQNIYAVLEVAAKSHPSPTVSILLFWFGKLFSSTYLFARLVVSPFLAIWLIQDLLFTKKGRKNVPLGLGIIWVIMIVGVMGGSLPFARTTALNAWYQ
jgi:hypothetical protein